MYAIIDDRGSQYRVQEGDTLEIQRQTLPPETEQIVFDRVLMVGEGAGAQVGQPYLTDARVTATVRRELKGHKITILKMKRRKGYRRKMGHRQKYLQIQIDKIETPTGEARMENEKLKMEKEDTATSGHPKSEISPPESS